MIRTLTSEGREQGRNLMWSVVDHTYGNQHRMLILHWLNLQLAVGSFNELGMMIIQLKVSAGISEYWFGLAALGMRSLLGSQEPSVFLFVADEVGYQFTHQGTERIISRTFPELNLTVEQVLKA